MKKVLLIATGGTIASKDSGKGLSPELGAGTLLSYIPEIEKKYELDTIQLFNIESPDIKPYHWGQIVVTIKKYYDSYDGFVIIHGTDTLAYTSSALSYMIQNCGKTVVVTGAQYPIEFDKTDGIRNLEESCIFAADSNMPGVYVIFDGKAMFGNHVKKVKSRSLDAFYSVNYPNAAAIKDGMITKFCEVKSDTPVMFKENMEENIFLLKFYPGIKPKHYTFVKDTFRAVVMEGYGVAGIPGEFMPLFEEWNQKGIILVVTTQVMYEGTDMEVYTVGKAMASRFNAIQSYDMTLEAVISKLMQILAVETDINKIKEKFNMPVQHDLKMK